MQTQSNVDYESILAAFEENLKIDNLRKNKSLLQAIDSSLSFYIDDFLKFAVNFSYEKDEQTRCRSCCFRFSAGCRRCR